MNAIPTLSTCNEQGLPSTQLRRRISLFGCYIARPGELTEVVMFTLWDSLDAIRSSSLAMSTSLHGFIQRTTGSSSSVISWPNHYTVAEKPHAIASEWLVFRGRRLMPDRTMWPLEGPPRGGRAQR